MSNNKQQTAVEWLYKNLKSHFEHDGDLLEATQMSYEQAKQMEKQKLEEAWVEGFKNWNPSKTFDDYYDKTYGDKMNEQETKLTGDKNNNPGLTMDMVTGMKTTTIASSSGQNNTGTYPEPGQIWQHYKGGRYKIIAMCNHTTTNEAMVIYKSLSFNGYHARPYSEWHDEVSNGNNCVTRFVWFN